MAIELDIRSLIALKRSTASGQVLCSKMLYMCDIDKIWSPRILKLFS